MPKELWAFLGVVAVMAVLPGPDMALAIRNGIAGGRRAALLTGLGFAIGLTIWAAASVLGLAALLAALPGAFTAVRIAGAVYLVWLGAGSLRAAYAGSERAGRLSLAAREDVASHPRAWLRQGVVSNLLNPKIALLFITLLPQFVVTGEGRTGATAILAAAMVLLSLAWWVLFAFAVGTISGWLSRPAVRRAVQALAGVILIALALRVAL
ncbi:MAG TPA: LysE family translocator [Solirubrobacteraceae bacterium]|nr:LysE family translocator [Solirubrobacteraceae bacterium]